MNESLQMFLKMRPCNNQNKRQVVASPALVDINKVRGQICKRNVDI